MTKAELNQLFAFWNKESQNDFSAAKDIIRKAKRYANGLFFLHLSIEKKLKAIYAKKFHSHAPFTHNLLALVEKLDIDLPKKMTDHLSVINQFNMSTRYPEEKKALPQS